MTPSERIHAAILRLEAEKLSTESQLQPVAKKTTRPVVVIVEENLAALCQGGDAGHSLSADAEHGSSFHPPQPITIPTNQTSTDTLRRQHVRSWATAVGIVAVVAVLASAAPFSSPIRKGHLLQPTLLGSDQSVEGRERVKQPIASIAQSRHASFKIIETSWVSACTDEKEVFADLLTPTDTREFTFSKNAVVRVGNASGVEITVDGVSLGPLGGPGRLRRIEIGPNGFRFLPLKSGDGGSDCPKKEAVNSLHPGYTS